MVKPERYRQVKEIFAAAVEYETGERANFLARACATDEELRAEVESLLAHDRPAENFIEESAFEVSARLRAESETQSLKERHIGPYKVVREIGRGGMGVVYLAFRDDDHFRKEVAIKLIKRGMDTDVVVRRFRNERQILAGLEHPFIARLLDGGATDDGLPYLVMEYVSGTPLMEYCDQHCVATKERLQLFRAICSAVQHAHQNLIVHRDLKPSNIIITPDGTPKLLDFGIAKVLNPAQPDLTVEQTRPHLTALTPDYASPEQVLGNKITTASDIYSLGVILYELLTGTRPYKLRESSPEEMLRVICHTELTRPSEAGNRKSSSGRFSADGQRRTETKAQPRSLKFLKGDLDNIVLTALKKEPERRYSSVAQLSEDIRRYIEGLPVIAHKDSFSYRASKFIRRNRGWVAAAALLFIAILVGLVATAWQARVAARERNQARQEKAKAEEIKNFLVRMLNYSNPLLSTKGGGETSVTELLDEATKRLESGEFSEQPEIRAELEQIIGEAYLGQGRYNLAEKHMQEYVNLQRQRNGENHPKTLVARASWAQLLFFKGSITEAENAYRQVLPLMREEQKRGAIKAETLADTLNNFAYLRRTQGDSREAEGLFREALALNSQIPDESRHVNATTRSTLASTLADQGRFEEALQVARDSVAEYRQRGESDTANFGFTLTILGGFLIEKGEYAEGDASLHRAETLFRRLLASSSLWLGDNLRNQAISLYSQGKYKEALSRADETLNIYRESFGTHYDHYPTALIIKGLSLSRMGQAQEGEKILREAVRIRTDSLPAGHFWVALARSALGECLTIQKRYQEAEPLLLQSYESLRDSQGINNPRTRLALGRLVALYESWRKPDRAAEYRSNL